MEVECLDHNVCQEMNEYVEQLTMSGKPNLDMNIMKKFKKICRVADMYVKHAYHLLMTQLDKEHAEVRLSAFQMIDELFNRSHEFRELLVSEFQTFLELTVETDPECPLPPPVTVARKLKAETLKAVQQWQEKYGDVYKKLTLVYHYLQSCKNVDFNDIQARTVAERRRSQEKERKKQAFLRAKLKKVLEEIKETSPDMQNSICEIENCLHLLLPPPESFFISESENLDECNTTETSVQQTPSHSSSEKCTSVPVSDPPSEKMNKNNVYSRTDIDVESNKNFDSTCDQVLDIDNSTARLEIVKRKETSHLESASSVNEVDRDDSVSKDVGDECDDDDDDEDDDFEEVSSSKEDSADFVQDHGLGSRQYNININIVAVEPCVKENEDNCDILNSLHDMIGLVNHKYLPLVTKWLEILSKTGADEKDIKSTIDLKNHLSAARQKCIDLKIIPASKIREDKDESDDDDFEEVTEKEGYEPHIPVHLRAEYGLKPEEKTKEPEKFMASITPQFWSLKAMGRLESKQDPTTMEANLVRCGIYNEEDEGVKYSSGRKRGAQPSTSRETTLSTSDDIKRRAPVVPFGVDLEHWEDPSSIEKPVVIKYDSLHRFWNPAQIETEKPNENDLALLTNRTFHYTGTFEPVKWKCRMPMPNGNLCERMDRKKCPFHGAIIARDEFGRPAKQADAARLAKDEERRKEQALPDWQDPELQRDIETALGLDLGSGRQKGRGKGKGKGKGKSSKKDSSLTNIKQARNTSRARLEKKVFSVKSVQRVANAMDAADYKRVRDKFGNQFNYTHTK